MAASRKWKQKMAGSRKIVTRVIKSSNWRKILAIHSISCVPSSPTQIQTDISISEVLRACLRRGACVSNLRGDGCSTINNCEIGVSGSISVRKLRS